MSSNCEKSCGKCKSGKKRVINPILPGVWKDVVSFFFWGGGLYGVKNSSNYKED